MSKPKFCDREKSAPSWNYFWMISSSNWSQIFQEEFLKANQKPLEEEESIFVRQIISLGVWLTLILLISIAGIQAKKIPKQSKD